jgi:hypothetical protein
METATIPHARKKENREEMRGRISGAGAFS